MNKPNEIKAKIGGMYSFKVKRADGTVEDLGHQRNLILDTGYDYLYAFDSGISGSNFAAPFTVARIGTGNTAATAGDTALQTQTASHAAYVTTDGSNGSTYDTAEGSVLHKRTFQFAAASGSSTIAEVGVGWTASTASTLFSRIVLGTTISLNTGDVLFVIYTLKVIFDQIVNSTEVNLTTGTFALVGDLKITNTLASIFGLINANGTTSTSTSTGIGSNVLCGASGAAKLYNRLGTNTAFPTVNTDTGFSDEQASPTLTSMSHTNGTKTVSGQFSYPGPGAVSGVRSVGIGWTINPPGSSPTNPIIWILLDNAQTKEDLKILRFTYTVTYSQI
jgi:hypothetical protein